jgi:MtrB/PioB family decaheme-associated outer membrane protein
MNTKHISFAVLRTAAIAGGMLFPMLASAADPTPTVVEESEITQLTRPKSTVEAGVGVVTDSSWKFGQYNGLNNSGAFGIGNFDIRGGGAYDSNDATRWRVTGNNIGLENRSFTGEYKDQGKYKLNFGYDEIPRYLNNSYQTPYLGTGNSANLVVPNNWQYPANGNMRNLSARDLSDFHTVNMGTKRERIDGGFSYFLSPQWEAQASMRHENKNGTQALGAVLNAGGDKVAILPNPIAQTTDQINASMKYTGDKGFGQFAYYGSLFHNDINGVTFQNLASGPSSTVPSFGRMSSAPDNQFHQFSLTGGYNFSPATKLVANGAYARNWQNQNFLPYSTAGAFPATANLNGDVTSTAVNLKLTHKVNKDLNFASTYKYDERQNNTPINVYSFADIDQKIAANNQLSNTPYSKRINQGNLDANYSFAQGHWLKAGYEIQNIDRWCSGTWISCVDTGTTTENTGRLDYRGVWTDKINGKLGYAYSHRTADNYNQDNAAWPQYPQTVGNALLYTRIAASGLPAWGPFLPYANTPPGALFPNNNPAANPTGNNNYSFDINGLGRFNTSSRDRQKATSYINYQVTDKLSTGLGGDYRYDNYPNSSFGLQSSRNWGINLDSSYAFNEDTSAQLFYSYQNILSNSAGMSYGNNSNTGSTALGSVVGGCVPSIRAMNNTAKIDPCRNWNTGMNDNIDTVGLGAKHKGFLNGKLDINGDFLFSFARTLIDVTGGNYQLPTGGTKYYYTPAANMPTVKTQTFTFKLDAKYIINKPSAVHLGYMYQRMLSSDYIYTGMQPIGAPQGVMPTFEQAPQYSIHVVGLSYIYNF